MDKSKVDKRELGRLGSSSSHSTKTQNPLMKSIRGCYRLNCEVVCLVCRTLRKMHC